MCGLQFLWMELNKKSWNFSSFIYQISIKCKFVLEKVAIISFLPFDKKLLYCKWFHANIVHTAFLFSSFQQVCMRYQLLRILSCHAKTHNIYSNWLLGSYFNVCPYYHHKGIQQLKLSNDFLSLIKMCFKIFHSWSKKVDMLKVICTKTICYQIKFFWNQARNVH